MRNTLVLLGAALTLGAPALGQAATRCQQDNRGNEVAGTVAGAVIGGVIGNSVSHGRSRGAGTAIGAIGGGVIGNRLAASGNQPCPDGYSAYDDGVVYQDGQTAYPNDDRQPQSYAVDQYGRQIPTYSRETTTYAWRDANAPDSYRQGYPAASQDYYSSSTGGYTEEQNRRERRAFAMNQSGAYGQRYANDGGYRSDGYTSNGYTSNGYASQASVTWQDAYGRSCYWSNRSGDDQNPNWAQVCR